MQTRIETKNRDWWELVKDHSVARHLFQSGLLREEADAVISTALKNGRRFVFDQPSFFENMTRELSERLHRKLPKDLKRDFAGWVEKYPYDLRDRLRVQRVQVRDKQQEIAQRPSNFWLPYDEELQEKVRAAKSNFLRYRKGAIEKLERVREFLSCGREKTRM